MSVAAVYNPVAGSGRAGREWPQAERLLRSHFPDIEVAATTGPGSAARLAEDWSRRGKKLVVACGGDGTLSEAADGLLRANTDVTLGCIPAGTGSDLSKTLSLPVDLADSIGRIIGGSTRRIDAGRLSFVDDGGNAASRHFINIASLGVSGPTDRAVNAAKSKGSVGGKLVYLFHTIRELVRYRFQDVRLTVDDLPPVEARIAVVAIANGKYFGGGMMIAPDADPGDGWLEVVIFRAAGKLSLIRDMNLLYTGAHVGHPLVSMLRGRRITVEPAGGLAANAALLDIDGESPGRIPATFEVLPNALKVTR